MLLLTTSFCIWLLLVVRYGATVLFYTYIKYTAYAIFFIFIINWLNYYIFYSWQFFLLNYWHLYFFLLFNVALYFVYLELLILQSRVFYWVQLYFYWTYLVTYIFCLTNSLLVFFLMYESIQLPAIYILYSFTKSARALYAAILMCFWTLIGAFFLILGFIYLIYNYAIYTFVAYEYLVSGLQQSIFLYICLFIGFGVKIPLWPASTWLLLAHVEAPTFWSIFLSGAYIKYPAFGILLFFKLLNFYLYLFIFSFLLFQLFLTTLSIWYQSDLKQLVAVITICEMQLNLFILLCFNNLSTFIWYYLFLGHVWNTTFGFWLVDFITKLYQTRELRYLSGITYNNFWFQFYILGYLFCLGGFPYTFVFWIEWLLCYFNLAVYIYWLLYIILIFNFGSIGLLIIKWHAVLFGRPQKFFQVRFNRFFYWKFFICFFGNFFLSTLLIIL